MKLNNIQEQNDISKYEHYGNQYCTYIHLEMSCRNIAFRACRQFLYKFFLDNYCKLFFQINIIIVNIGKLLLIVRVLSYN